MKAKYYILVMLASLIMQGCTTLPASPVAPAISSLQRVNVLLPDFVYGYPMHY